ncbi:ABC transporter ATP-binding protein [Compostimonas suwonensis]|uniref:Branched-chain amino acid transport system ATP-binding protein n=1 Tax=Compostimonas suwonensis TaxID=1048394 RepID=A0A2M9BCD3_9MICO|nr:ABC transporter ATP-binding protein [Compostimonas suwonensis]PJJ55610.1 branched-chain amino acid transport system ATP-binding protein [Compostimonas suwonensis]
MKLEISGLTKNFGGLRALTDVSFTAEDGELTAVIGPNGAGKTTMFNCIAGFHRVSSGTVTLGGRVITGLKPAQVLGSGLARTFQLVRAFEGLTVLETVMTAGHARSGQRFGTAMLGLPSTRRSENVLRDEAYQTLAALGVEHLADSHLQELPYGQQRLVEIAKALATGADVLLLDEPAAGLHSTEVGYLASVLASIKETGRTVLMIEHNMPFVMGLADKIVVLDFGKKLAEGEPESVRTNQAVIDAYLGRADRDA